MTRAEGKAVWRRIAIECAGAPSGSGAQAAIDITQAFRKRHWQRAALCAWDGVHLTLTAENDFDPSGFALADEFSDELSACVSAGFDGDIRIVSISEIGDQP